MRFIAALIAIALVAGCVSTPDVTARAYGVATAPAYGSITTILNRARSQQRLAPLSRSGKLDRAAAGHAADMVRGGFFSHQSSDGSDLMRRIRNVGFNACFVSENIAWGQATEAAVFGEWMNSPDHRRNILSGKPVQFGLGKQASPKGTHWVMVFARPC